MRPLACLFGPLDEIEAALDAFADSPDAIRDLSHAEIAALFRFERTLRRTCDGLRRVLDATERGVELSPAMWGMIHSMDHPIVQKLIREAKDASDRAARIRRQNLAVARDCAFCDGRGSTLAAIADRDHSHFCDKCNGTGKRPETTEPK